MRMINEIYNDLCIKCQEVVFKYLRENCKEVEIDVMDVIEKEENVEETKLDE